jgi:hypothetical protein
LVVFPWFSLHFQITIGESVNHQGPQGPHVECSFPLSCSWWARRPRDNS